MMKDILNKLAELEATAPKVTKKKMLNEDSTTPPMNVSNKMASLKDMFEALSESIPPGQKPLPVLDPQNKQAGMGFVTSNNPAVQNMLKALDPKDVQIVQAPGQPGQAPAAGQPAQAGATGQPQMGQMQMKEKDEGKPGKNFAKIAKSAGKRYGSKEAGERVAGAVRAKLAKQGKLEEESVEESGLQAYLGNKKYGKDGMDALRKAGRDHAGKEKMANIRAKYDKMDEAQLDELSPELLNRAALKASQQKADFASKARERGIAGSADEFRASEHPIAKAANAKLAQQKKFQAGAATATTRDQEREDLKDLSPAMKRKLGMSEGDLPSSSGVDTKGAGLGAGRSQTTLEAKEPQVEVIDNAFNRENYKDLIGKKYPKSKAPSYARVKEVTEGKKGVNPFPKKDDKASTKTPAKGKKPDFLDLDKDGNKKEPMKKAAADKKKQKVKESMNHRISAARLEGKSHGLRGHAHSGKRYEDMSEMKAYHEGYKEGLDECYGQGVYETAPAATVGGMASQAMPTMEDDMDEGNAFTAALAKTPKGEKFSVGGKTFTDRTGYDAKVNEYAFESLDQQLNALLNESEEVSEGLSVSISKGQQNSPDSVTITAQDQEAEHLLAFVKNAGLGLFGDDNADTHSSAMSVQPSHGAPDEVGAGGIDIGVVDGHDGMMGLMQKLSGIQAGGAEDYADEEGEEQLYGNHQAAGKKDCGCDGDCECSDYDQPSNEATCNECGTYEGVHEAGCSMGSGKEMVDEVESEDQMEFEVAEDNAPDSGEAESTADEDAEAQEDAALAKSDSKGGTYTVNEDGDEASEEGPESKEGEGDEGAETVSESFANLFKKLAFIAEESTEKKDEKAEKAGKKVAKDIEYDEGDKGKDDDKAEKAGKKVTKDIEYDDKKDKKEKVGESLASLLDRLTKLAEGSGDEPKHSEHDKKDDKDQDDAEEELEESVEAGTSKEELAKEIFKIDDRINQIYNHGAGNSPEPLERKLEGLQAQWNQQFSGEDPMKLGKALWQQYHADQKAANSTAASPAQPQQKSFMGRMADKAKQTFGMKEEELNEWANNAGPGKTVSDTTFEQDIDFMTKVISGGLNKPKSTGQTTIPVIAGQDDRMHDNPMDWATLAGIKK